MSESEKRPPPSPSPPVPIPLRERDRRSSSDTPAPSPLKGEVSGESASVLGPLGLTPEQSLELTGGDRSRLLNFLLRWERFDTLHACLDVLMAS